MSLNKLVLILCFTGLVCSGIALLVVNEQESTEKSISIEQYIEQVNETNEHQVNVTENTASSINILNENKHGQLPISEHIEVEHEIKININTATVEQLQQLKGVGPSKAKAIIAEREKGGAFKTIDEIKRVKGIGNKIFESIKESIVN